MDTIEMKAMLVNQRVSLKSYCDTDKELITGKVIGFSHNVNDDGKFVPMLIVLLDDKFRGFIQQLTPTASCYVSQIVVHPDSIMELQ